MEALPHHLTWIEAHRVMETLENVVDEDGGDEAWEHP
jgi:hypothetical protein